MEVSNKNNSRISRPTLQVSENLTLSKSDENLARCMPITLSWHHIVVKHKQSNRTIIDDVSGIVQPGQFVALMGASGAGKTTLLNTLMSRNLQGLTIEGDVLVDGVNLGSKITNVSGFVQQEELFLPTLTVKEHLMLQARLRLSGSNAQKREKRVDELLNDLNLMKCRSSRIGINGIKKGISGGESKRLLFASELLNDPPLLFCDEPTTGLDSAMAESVVITMRKLAEKGHTIICTIHQPSAFVFNSFTRVMFLAGGRLAYFGPPEGCVDMFARFGYTCRKDYNPADMLIETLAVEPHNKDECLERIKKICDQYAESEEGVRFREDVSEAVKSTKEGAMTNREKEHLKHRNMVIFPIQLWALLQRSIIDNWRNPALVRAKILLKIFMGLFIGLLYLQTEIHRERRSNEKDAEENHMAVTNFNGALFFLINELTYATAMGILTFLPDDYPLVVREYHDGLYYLASYYIARCLSYVPLFTIDGLLMMGICYYMIGFARAASRFFTILGISLLVEQSAAAFGVMLSTCSPSYHVAIVIASPLLTVLSLCGGLYVNVGLLPDWIKWMQYLSWFRYGFEAFAITQWDGVGAETKEHCIYYPNGTNDTTCVKSDNILSQFSFKEENLAKDILIMASIILVFYFIGFIGLLIRVRRSR